MYNIVLVTGSRAEYGIMRQLISKLKDSKDINLSIVATAMHMEEKYGYTYKDIENDGFTIDHKIDMKLTDTSDKTILKSMSILQNDLADYFQNKEFDLCIILGDRYEMLSVVNSCIIYKIPICHLHGGEKTLGNYDEFIRHSISKMSHIHLTSTDEYKNRVLQLGESPNHVYNIGSLGVENALTNQLLSKQELNKKLGCNLQEYFVVLFHPVTLDLENSLESQVKNLLNALNYKGIDKQIVFIGSNSDSGSDLIGELINDFISKNDRAIIFKSLNTLDYHSLVKNSLGLIGNSSSGLIEVPSLGVPTLNIGDRQKGRVRGNSVIDVSSNLDDICAGIAKLQEFKRLNIDILNPYYKVNSCQNAFDIILNELKIGVSISKDFIDIKE